MEAVTPTMDQTGPSVAACDPLEEVANALDGGRGGEEGRDVVADGEEGLAPLANQIHLLMDSAPVQGVGECTCASITMATMQGCCSRSCCHGRPLGGSWYLSGLSQVRKLAQLYCYILCSPINRHWQKNFFAIIHHPCLTCSGGSHVATWSINAFTYKASMVKLPCHIRFLSSFSGEQGQALDDYNDDQLINFVVVVLL